MTLGTLFLVPLNLFGKFTLFGMSCSSSCAPVLAMRTGVVQDGDNAVGVVAPDHAELFQLFGLLNTEYVHLTSQVFSAKAQDATVSVDRYVHVVMFKNGLI